MAGRIGRDAGRKHPHEQRCAEAADQGHQGEHGAQGARHHVEQFAHVLVPAIGLHLGENRHKSLGQGPFGEHAAAEIGDLQGQEKDIHHRPGAEERGEQDVAHETQDA